ncbi:kinase-like domain-containing protein, partial [Pavlovales sp. CCMP2436]
GKLYIVTELVDGASLLDHLTALREKGERLGEERVWQIFVQLLLALRYCHKTAAVVHRDLTPANVLLTADGSVKLADFGLAKRRESASAMLESVVGTVIYQPPEIIKHEAYSDRADIWSLGCILYETAMLEPPFAGSNPLVVASRI